MSSLGISIGSMTIAATIPPSQKCLCRSGFDAFAPRDVHRTCRSVRVESEPILRRIDHPGKEGWRGKIGRAANVRGTAHTRRKFFIPKFLPRATNLAAAQGQR
jgi:hypothetical protein